MKKSIWDKILKIVIAVASAIVGALSANAMNIVRGKINLPRK
ncbi:MAG: smalltalk protein [Bacteroides cellulosilyticus]